jgi:hypothetical protein
VATTSSSGNGANQESSNAAGHLQIANPALGFLIAEIALYAKLNHTIGRRKRQKPIVLSYRDRVAFLIAMITPPTD